MATDPLASGNGKQQPCVESFHIPRDEIWRKVRGFFIYLKRHGHVMVQNFRFVWAFLKNNNLNMLGETYTTASSANKKGYLFESVGSQGVILKAVIFQKLEPGERYNLAFGDVKNGDIDDEVVTIL